MKPQLTPEAKAIVAEAIENIKAKPNQFNMISWCEKDNGCGTVGCLAGHIVFATGLKVKDETVSARAAKKLFGKELVSQMEGNYNTIEGRIHVETVADRLLNSGGSEVDVQPLFHTDQWPEPFQTQYEKLNGNELNSKILHTNPKKGESILRKRAALAIRRLRHWLKTGE